MRWDKSLNGVDCALHGCPFRDRHTHTSTLWLLPSIWPSYSLQHCPELMGAILFQRLVSYTLRMAPANDWLVQVHKSWVAQLRKGSSTVRSMFWALPHGPGPECRLHESTAFLDSFPFPILFPPTFLKIPFLSPEEHSLSHLVPQNPDLRLCFWESHMASLSFSFSNSPFQNLPRW